jgi:hypothetical protein
MLEERTFGKNFDQKEREIRRLQGQVKEIDDFLKASKDIKYILFLGSKGYPINVRGSPLWLIIILITECMRHYYYSL